MVSVGYLLLIAGAMAHSVPVWHASPTAYVSPSRIPLFSVAMAHVLNTAHASSGEWNVDTEDDEDMQEVSLEASRFDVGIQDASDFHDMEADYEAISGDEEEAGAEDSTEIDAEAGAEYEANAGGEEEAEDEADAEEEALLRQKLQRLQRKRQRTKQRRQRQLKNLDRRQKHKPTNTQQHKQMRKQKHIRHEYSSYAGQVQTTGKQAIEEQSDSNSNSESEDNYAVVQTDADDDAIEALEELGSNPELSRDNDAIMPLFRHFAMGSHSSAPINTKHCDSIDTCQRAVDKCRGQGEPQIAMAASPGEVPARGDAAIPPDVCIETELLLSQLKYLKYSAHHAPRGTRRTLLTRLVPLASVETDLGVHSVQGRERLENFFEGPIFTGLQTRLDLVAGVKAIMADQSLHQYRNTSLEHVLAHVNCQGMSQIFVCRMAIHAALRLVGHDSPSAWVLWERLGHYWRAEGEAYYAIQCFRKALTLEPRRQTIVYNVAMVLYNLDFCEDAHGLLKPLAEANPNYIVYQISHCQVLAALAKGTGQVEKSYDVRAKFGEESRSCFDKMVLDYPGLKGIADERKRLNEHLFWLWLAENRVIVSFIALVTVPALMWLCYNLILHLRTKFSVNDHSVITGDKKRGKKQSKRKLY